MDFNRFTVKAREALGDAQNLAAKYGNPEIRPAHVLLTLLTQEKGVVVSLVKHVGIQLDQFQREAASLLEKLPKVSGSAMAIRPRSYASIRSLRVARRPASAPSTGTAPVSTLAPTDSTPRMICLAKTVLFPFFRGLPKRAITCF